MPRGPKKPADVKWQEQIQKIDERIARLTKEIAELKVKKEECLEELDKVKMQEVLSLMSEKKVSVEEIKAYLNDKE